MFSIIGIFYAVLQIALLWWLIDILNYPTFIVTAIVVSLIYITKFYTYVWIKLMKKKFWYYNMVNVFLFVLNIVLIWVMVDYLHLLASVSSAIVTISLFISRFFVLKKFKLLN